MKGASAMLVLAACTVLPAVADDSASFSRGERFDARSGEAIYRSICQGCHLPDGQGARGAGVYPSLARDARLDGAAYPVAIVLHGNRNMPSFADTLDDAQVAGVVTYIRSHFGNAHDDVVTPEQVAVQRPAR